MPLQDNDGNDQWDGEKCPQGAHIRAQKAIDRKTRKGFKVWRCPIIVGVMNCPSKVVTKIQIIGIAPLSA